MTIISVDDVKKDYQFYRKTQGFWGAMKNLIARKKEINHAIKGISFEIEEGEFVGFIGPNGAGKTTTLKMLSGVLYPTDGTLDVLGFNPSDRKKEF
ncbi:MAG: ATP-binding cassette domain-containing protein, partial [Candidatus Hodarchaeota archaeon]